MELPEHYTPVRLQTIAREIEAVRAEPSDRLVAIASSPDEPLGRRYAAGTMLALLGDPRIDVMSPAMVDIPGGRARIGLDPAQVDEVTATWARVGVERAWIAKEAPAFDVELRPYRLGKYPVTNLEYRVFLDATSYPELPTRWALGSYPLHEANHPVFTVSAEAADAYAVWLSAKTGRSFRLPTEAEWEHAASGDDGWEFPWGDAPIEDGANTIELQILDTTPVGIFPRGASPFGALDMAGNVEEYVADEYAPYPGAALVEDDLLRETGRYRVARGGSFARFLDLARCRRRHGRYPAKLYSMGFRLAEDG